MENSSHTYRWVGKSVWRVDGIDKVTGKLKFPSDYNDPNALVCKAVYAPSPHARILGKSTNDAEQVPGVVRVLTHKDVPGVNYYGFKSDRPFLCADKTRFAGDMVAIVVAESDQAASQAIEKFNITWEPLPLVLDPERALEDGSPLVHENGNILHEIHFIKGDIGGVFGRPDIVETEHTIYPQMLDHAYLETEAGLAYPEDGGIVVISGAQVPYADQMWLSQCLALPMEKTRLIEPFSGGAFGGRGDISVQLAISLAALVTGKPCRMAWDRSEHFRAGVKRHPCKIWLRVASKRSGELLALEARIIADTGGYAVFGDSILETMVENITGLYRFPNVKIDAWSVYTNNPVSGAFRGFGASQACLALEGQLTQIARIIGMDDIDLRLKNLLSQGETSGMGHTLSLPIGVAQALEAAKSHPLWKEKGTINKTEGPVRRGIGLALATKGFGLGTRDAPDFAAVDLVLDPTGKFHLTTGIVEIGQGSHTVLMQMAAETLNCGPEFFKVDSADTMLHPDSGTTAASRVTYAVGLAAVDAATHMKETLKTLASRKWETVVDKVELVDGVLTNQLTGETLTLEQIASLSDGSLIVRSRLRVPFSETEADGGLAHPHVLYSSNVQIAQVAVDTETGQVNVEKVVTFPEAGRVINPLGLEGQCEGGIVQGIGYALMEKVHTRDGMVQNDHFGVYPIPTSMDIPYVEVVPVEVPEASGPYGAKGAGENATIPTAPAILNAITDAVNIHVSVLPVTPENLLDSLNTF